MVQPPIPPTPIDPDDDNVEDDSLLRPITTPPERDREQAKYGDETPSEMGQTVTPEPTGGAVPMVPLIIVAVVIIALLLFWLL